MKFRDTIIPQKQIGGKLTKRLLIRADDLGFSEGVNYGIAKTVACGLVGSVGVMTNMDTAAHGVALLKEWNVCLGQEINLLKFTPKFRDKSSSVTDRTTNLLLFELRYDKVK